MCLVSCLKLRDDAKLTRLVNEIHVWTERAATFIVVTVRNFADKQTFTHKERGGRGEYLLLNKIVACPGVKAQFTTDGTASDGVMTTELRQQSGNFIIRATDRCRVVTLEVSVAAESLF